MVGEASMLVQAAPPASLAQFSRAAWWVPVSESSGGGRGQSPKEWVVVALQLGLKAGY